MAHTWILSSLLIGLAISAQAAEPELISATAQRCKGNASYKVHLSFDDGPKIPETEIILDILKKNNIKATFLISTSRFRNLLKGPPSAKDKKLMALLERMKKEGHTIGNHSFEHIEHANLKVHSQEEIENNLHQSFQIIDKLGLKKPMPFRFPYGSGWFGEPDSANQGMASLMMKEVKGNGYMPFHWDIDSWDWSKIKRKALPESVLSQICSHGGGVVLMHDIQKFTAANLQTMIQSIRDSGHEFASEEEIIKYSKVDPKGPLVSLEDKAAGIRVCGKHVGDLDQVSSTCDNYPSNSSGNKGGVN